MEQVQTQRRSLSAHHVPNPVVPRRVSVVVPIFNDANLAFDFLTEIERVFSQPESIELGIESWEIIFVDDGSSSTDQVILDELAKNDDRVLVIHLSRNFGQHPAIKCGIDHALGELVARANVDLQDPPASLIEMIRVIRTHQVDRVIGVYPRRATTLSDRLTSQIYYRLFGLLSGLKVPQNTSALRVMTSRFAESLRQCNESRVHPQELEEWVGFSTAYIQIHQQARASGSSSYTFTKRLGLAAQALSVNLGRIFRATLFVGFLALLGSLMLLGYAVIRTLVADRSPGFLTIASLQGLTIGLVVVLVGVVGLIANQAFEEARSRPAYMIKDIVEFKNARLAEAQNVEP